VTTSATFDVDITDADRIRFAELSGDWNPLHTDPAHAAQTAFGRPVLHGAYAAGLVSRMAGMHLPGADCLLHGMRLRFVTPIVPPVRLRVRGALRSPGVVDVTIDDIDSGRRHVTASYEFGHHDTSTTASAPATASATDAGVLVTGATGGLGDALHRRLGEHAIGTSRRAVDGMLQVLDGDVLAAIGDRRLTGAVHCAWPTPDNVGLLRIDDIGRSIDHHVAAPLRDVVAIAQALAVRGEPGAVLVLVGSTFSEPGAHGYRSPLYSAAKSTIPSLARTLAFELAPKRMRCVAVVFDIVRGGMNAGMSDATALAHADRTPSGELPSADDVAAQIEWVLGNQSALVSGATITLSGGALP
jgi:acyl dehydratase/NAD(P)-dependent dehydrogenase (short-subunit alcohol dehydrogenase family)